MGFALGLEMTIKIPRIRRMIPKASGFLRILLLTPLCLNSYYTINFMSISLTVIHYTGSVARA